MAQEKAPETRAEAKPEPKPSDNPVLKPHVLRETEVRPIHRFVGRITKRLGMPLEADELSALDEHGARFWSRWIANSWQASAFAYVGTWGEIIVSRAVERAIEERERAREPKRDGAGDGPAPAPDAPRKANGPVDDKLDDVAERTYGKEDRS